MVCLVIFLKTSGINENRIYTVLNVTNTGTPTLDGRGRHI